MHAALVCGYLNGRPPTLGLTEPLQDLTFFTALLFGFTMLTRASNYLPISSAAYHLNTEHHIAFTVVPLPGAGGSPIEVMANQLGYSSSSHHWRFSRLLSQIKDGLERQRASDPISSLRSSSARLRLRYRDHSLRICYHGSTCPGQALLPCSEPLMVPVTSSLLQLTVTRSGDKTRSGPGDECTLIRYASVAPQSSPPHKFPTM